jgi:flavin reductase
MFCAPERRSAGRLNAGLASPNMASGEAVDCLGEYQMTVDPNLFRAGMRLFTGGVCLITTADAGGRRGGLTATAVCSVTMEPPTLLICVNRRSSSHDLIRAAGVFAVNVLASSDRALADRFSGAESGDARFAIGEWSRLATGAPILDSALVSFDCKIAQMVDVGSHGVFFGEVQDAQVRGDSAVPLLYLQGNYGSFGALHGDHSLV